jgi:FkbM family methyltransferase
LRPGRLKVAAALLLRPVWLLTWPLRVYWLHSERKLGKRLLLDRLVKPRLPPPPRGFVATIPGGGRVHVHYREDLGLALLLGGGWERAELEHVSRLARPGTTAVDVGANIGVYTAALASAVGPRGRVLAFEPEPSNVERLRENVARNGFANVDVHAVALAGSGDRAVLHLAADPMYHSTGEVSEGRAVHAEIAVEARTLDDVWQEAGRPAVSFVKIDTEGTELSVLEGAEHVLEAKRPTLIVETRDSRIEPWLAERGYAASRPRGFARGNVLFAPGPR